MRAQSIRPTSLGDNVWSAAALVVCIGDFGHEQPCALFGATGRVWRIGRSIREDGRSSRKRLVRQTTPWLAVIKQISIRRAVPRVTNALGVILRTAALRVSAGHAAGFLGAL